ncbi:hypothetical protein LDO51_17505 [Providencia alcalifaciens]|uniref:hypothetical protein n=1 Tax=Providencia alcalifaciens TaxID=126385 RepID=UPI001CE0B584|nr:hypothetical protein [Providencia alcalifaciens]UBX48909.1 hypothetical protein LDO51_17505 [Providencia alcalifaciens]
MSGHPHADLMAKAAEIAKTDKEWWKHFEIRLTRGRVFEWHQFHSAAVFYPDDVYRFSPKPSTIKIGDYDVPEPVRKPLDAGQKYWVVSLEYGACPHIWTGSSLEVYGWLARGLIHLNEEAARTHISALLSFTKID